MQAKAKGVSPVDLFLARMDVLSDRCDQIANQEPEAAHRQAQNVIGKEIRQFKDEASKLTGDVRSVSFAHAYTMEARVHLAAALANAAVASRRGELFYPDASDRDGHLHDGREAINTALTYEKIPTAYHVLGDILRLSGRNQDAAVAYKKVIDSNLTYAPCEELAAEALKSLASLGVSYEQVEKASISESAAFGAKHKFNLPLVYNALKFLGAGIVIRMFFVNPIMLNISLGCFALAVLFGLLAYFNKS